MSYGAIPEDAGLIAPDKPLFIGLAARCEKAVIKFSHRRRFLLCTRVGRSQQKMSGWANNMGIAIVFRARQ